MNARKLVASMMVSALAIGTSTGALAADMQPKETKAMELTCSVAAVEAGQLPGGSEVTALPDGVAFFETLKDGEWMPAFQMTEATMAIAIPENLNDLSDEELAKLKVDLEMSDEELATFKADRQNKKTALWQIEDGTGTEAKATTIHMMALNTAE